MSKINSLQAAALSGSTASPATDTPAATAASQNKKPADASGSTVKMAAKPATKVKAATVKRAPSKPVIKPTVKMTTAKKIVKADKPAKEKTPKLKMERDSFTMPKVEYAQLYVLKERLVKLGKVSKKSELLRAGIMQLSAMTDAALKAAMAKVPAIKTGRPKKK